MKQKDLLVKLEKLIESNFSLVERNSIIPINNEYLVFGTYKLSGTKVYKHTTEIGEFSSQRTALSWCIADKYQQHRLAHDILNLENTLTTLSADLQVRTHLSAKLNQSLYRENVKIKLDHKKARLQHIRNQLDKCVDLAKYFQIRGFNNETARTGRSPSYRTSR